METLSGEAAGEQVVSPEPFERRPAEALSIRNRESAHRFGDLAVACAMASLGVLEAESTRSPTSRSSAGQSLAGWSFRGAERDAGVRSVQRAVAEQRREQRVAQVATVRYETGPGGQMQIDFGEK